MARTDIAHICPDCGQTWLRHERSPEGVICYCPTEERTVDADPVTDENAEGCAL